MSSGKLTPGQVSMADTVFDQPVILNPAISVPYRMVRIYELGRNMRLCFLTHHCDW